MWKELLGMRHFHQDLSTIWRKFFICCLNQRELLMCHYHFWILLCNHHFQVPVKNFLEIYSTWLSNAWFRRNKRRSKRKIRLMNNKYLSNIKHPKYYSPYAISSTWLNIWKIITIKWIHKKYSSWFLSTRSTWLKL